MPIEIQGIVYFTANEVAESVEVSRQTLWRWRRDGSVPEGRRFRSGQTLFTESEVAAIRDFANRVEPVDLGRRDQIGLFNGT